jgi:flagellar protein FlgJ
MNPLLTGQLLGKAATDLAADARSLDSLKRAARSDPQAAIKQAASQFESLFMQMVLKSMRDALPKSGMLDSSAQQMYTGMLDQQLVSRMAGGTGLADMIARQLGQQVKAKPADVAAQDVGAQGAAARSAAAAQSLSVAGAKSLGAEKIQPFSAMPVAARPIARPAEPVFEKGGQGGFNSVKTHAPSAATNVTAADLTQHNAPAVANQKSARTEAQRAFVTKTLDHALAAQRATGVPAKFIIGQAALESGWGQREIKTATGQPSHNLFGIKAGASWKGPTVEVTTTEYVDGIAKRVVEKFRAYANYTEAFRDWARVVGDNPRYAQVLKNAHDAGSFAHAMQRAGYATDPQYGAKLARVIHALPHALRGSA